METFDAGTLNGAPQRFHMTVHGPVQSTVTANGRPYAVARQRSTFGRESVSIAALRDMTLGAGRTVNASTGPPTSSASPSTGPTPHTGTSPSSRPGSSRAAHRGSTGCSRPSARAPTTGAGSSRSASTRTSPIRRAASSSTGTTNRRRTGSRAMTSTPTARCTASSSPITSRPRSGCATSSRSWTAPPRRICAAPRSGPMWPRCCARVAPDARTAQAVQLVSDWSRRGASRLDANLDGKIDDPGAAIMDRAFSRIADAVIVPRLGSVADALANVNPRDRPANRGARPSARAGTATWTRICARCSGAGCRDASTCATAAAAP